MRFLQEPEPPHGVPLSVCPGIRRVVAPNPGPMTYHGTNTYLVDTPDGRFVLDPGPDDPGHVAAVLAAAAPVAGIMLSHTHIDHVGALPALRAATGAPVYGWHAPAIPDLQPDVPLRDGDAVGGWSAVFTPGHAADHLCFAGPDAVVFSADHVMGWSSSVISPPLGSMADYLASLRRLLDRNDRLFLPGHGPPVPQPQAFVRDLLAHRLAREAAVLAALDTAPRSVRTLTDRLYPLLDPPLRRAAERNVTAHLLKLRDEARAVEGAEGWTAGAPAG